jgi:pimeloyl-ACP methyl ester carboxylesterase
MGIDLDRLQRHRRFENQAAGYSEEFIQPRLGLGATVGVMSRPLGPSASTGWVICHSFGIEQVHLARMDVIAARALAAAGFPVLRFFGQGYGDSEHGPDVAGLSSHVAEAEEAAALLQRQDGVEEVGMMGGRFGGAVAALVAGRLGLPYLAMWDPVVRGKQYLRDLLRSEILSGIIENGEQDGGVHLGKIREALDSEGWTEIRGWPLSRQASDEISAIDLTAALESFTGAALVVALSRASKVPAHLTSLSQVISAAGGTCTVGLVQDPFAAQFGQFRWRTVEGGTSKRDTQLELNEKIAAVTAEWAVEHATPARKAAEVRP